MDGRSFDRDATAAKRDTRLGVVLGRERSERERPKRLFDRVGEKQKPVRAGM
jgi:hypothetical protein